MKIRLYKASLLLVVLLMLPLCLHAQLDSTIQQRVQAARAKNEVVTPLKFKERWAFKTNTIDWALMVANIGFEFDLSSSPYNRYTLGANVRYAGGADVPFDQKVDWKLFDARVELRRYWHPGLTMKRKRKPHYWRAYYWGAYANYSDYMIYLPNGFKGKGIGVGATFGYEIPLLNFKHGFLDLDLGLNIGFQYGDYEKSRMEGDDRMVTKRKDWEFIPYPLPQEVRVGLVYRFKSVREKYVKVKH